MSTREERPWGWFETIEQGSNYKVKKLFVKKGCRLSLQSHDHRDEHWVVVSGTGTVELSGEQLPVKTGQYLFVPKTQKHRIVAIDDVELIEVQMGICEERDIKRYQDDYGRA